MGTRAKVLIWLVVVAVPLGFLAWDIADLFADPKSEREVMGETRRPPSTGSASGEAAKLSPAGAR